MWVKGHRLNDREEPGNEATMMLCDITMMLCDITDCCCLLQDIITHQLPLEEVVKGLDLVNNSKESIKVVLLPSQ